MGKVRYVRHNNKWLRDGHEDDDHVGERDGCASLEQSRTLDSIAAAVLSIRARDDDDPRAPDNVVGSI